MSTPSAIRISGLTKAFGDLEVLGVGAQDPLARIHAPNESIQLEELQESIVAEALTKERCAALIISDPHSLCWLFNIRGGDIGNTPLALGYAIVRAKGEATLSELQGAEFAALQIQLLQVPAYATLVAAREFYLNVAPILAAQHFLAGWENVAVAVETARGQITEACLAQLDRTHVLEAGWYAISLMSVSKEQAANLKSPSPSRSGRNGSATAPADPTAGPSTAAPDGTSAAGSTPPILH